MSAVGTLSKENASAGAEPEATLRTEELSELYERYHKEVFHLALRYGRGDASWAEDVTQDVFLRLFRLRRKLYDSESLSGWFYRVTTRCCLNRLRHEALIASPLVRFVLGQRPPPRTPELDLVAKDDLDRAFCAVNRLPVKERAAFFMFYVDGREQREIAETLGHSKGYISKLLKRAAKRLEQEGWEVGHE